MRDEVDLPVGQFCCARFDTTVIPGQPAGLNPESISQLDVQLNGFRVRASHAPE
jgi:hypothetical protein